MLDLGTECAALEQFPKVLFVDLAVCAALHVDTASPVGTLSPLTGLVLVWQQWQFTVQPWVDIDTFTKETVACLMTDSPDRNNRGHLRRAD